MRDPFYGEEREGHFEGQDEHVDQQEGEQEVEEHNTDTGLWHIDEHGNKIPLTEEYVPTLSCISLHAMVICSSRVLGGREVPASESHLLWPVLCISARSRVQRQRRAGTSRSTACPK